MPQLWLTFALALYGFGLFHALLFLRGRREALDRMVVPAARAGVLFHFVALAESVMKSGRWVPDSVYQSESILALLLMAIFLLTYWRYKTLSHGIFVFPLVFLLTISTAVGEAQGQFQTPVLQSGWIFIHIALIFAGYAALFFSFASSILYLIQERSLKSKHVDALSSRLPALQVIDDIGFRSLMIGFPFMTLGLIAGAVLAGASYGAMFFRDPKIVLSMLMWAVYLLLLFSRWSVGWRGRRAAILSTVAFVVAAMVWAANYISSVHRFTQ